MSNYTPKTFLALGDSYSIGESVVEADRWPVRLARQLTANGIDVAAPTIIATTGWTTFELKDGIAAREAELDKYYDIVSLLIGVNNQFRGLSVEQYREDFMGLLDYAISKSASGKAGLFVVSIPDYAFTPTGSGSLDITAGVASFNEAARQICLAKGVLFVNITPISQRGLEEPNLVASDDLHPSGEQYRLWVEVLLKAVKF